MPSRPDYHLLPRSSTDLSETDETAPFTDKPPSPRPRKLFRKFRRVFRYCRPTYVFVLCIILLCWQLLFNGSYSSPKPFKIDTNDRVYIAANIVNGDLIRGDWGKGLKGLVELIGRDKVFVSVYGSPKEALDEFTKDLHCEKSIVSEEDAPIDLKNVSRTELPTGESKVKRMAFLAEVRNRALEPLRTSEKKFDKVLFINDVVFKPMDAARLLWGTNVQEDGKATYKAACAADFINSWKYYDTFATRDTEGYSLGVPIFPWFSAAGEGISRKDVLAGKEAVRVKSCWGGMVAFDAKYFQPDTTQKNTTKEYNPENNTPTLPLRFRFEPEPFWDASECCLIHADLIATPALPSSKPEDKHDTGIYMNPYVRVAYSTSTYNYIRTAKRFERLFALPQSIINHFAHMPFRNPRREEIEGQVITDRHWVPNPRGSSGSSSEETKSHEFGGAENNWKRDTTSHFQQGAHLVGRNLEKRNNIGELRGKEYWESIGFFEDYNRTARRGGYCGTRQLLVINEERRGTEVNWDKLLGKTPPVG